LERILLGWLRQNKKTPGWLALSLEAHGIEFAHGRFSAPKSHITVYGRHELAPDNQDLPRVAHAMNLTRYDCAALLRPGDYQLLLVEAPNVPKEELKAAIRWRIKDMIDYHVDDATVDVLDIPQQESSAARSRLMYAVSAKNEVIEATIRQCEAAKIPLSVIDIPETAQRNIAALYEEQARAVGLVYFAEEWGLVTVNVSQELYLARRFDVGLKEVTGDAATVKGALERVAVEIQRTLDHFDRQFRGIPVARLLVAPTPSDTAVAQFLTTRVGLQTQDIDLREVLAFDGEGPDRETQWRLFHHFGAALRHESKAL
jgi:MSHA biogenesis protein MshI